MDRVTSEIEALGSDEEKVRLGAISRLSEDENKRVINALIEALAHETPLIRIGACTVLGAKQAIKALPGLVRLLEDDNTGVRIEALKSLDQLNDPGIVNPLIIALGNSCREIRASAAQMLKRWGVNFGEVVSDALEKKSEAIMTLMEMEDPRVIAPLLVARTGKLIEYRWAAHEALSQMGDFAVETFIQVLSSNNYHIRIQVAGYLGKLGDIRALKPIERLLDDEKVEVKKSALIALGALGEPESFGKIAGAIEDEKLRISAVEALGLFGSYRALEFLIKLLQMDNNEVRKAVLQALINIGDTRALEPMFEREKIEKNNIVRDEIHLAIESIVRANESLEEDCRIMRCAHCFAGFAKYILKYSFFKKYSYFACSCCKSSRGIRNLEEVVAVLDKMMSESERFQEGYMFVNFYQRKHPFSFERLMLRGANDAEVDEFLSVVVDNNTDENFIKKIKNIPVFIFPSCNLNPNTVEKLERRLGNIEKVKTE
ncbi:MAG: HEAT repeat domain-containing protein [Candidatus Eremiobacteraeota bacterium]|nr:HEAT repeat domain-containing protein [Candidatus Eremiobacteraeota bacterium]